MTLLSFLAAVGFLAVQSLGAIVRRFDSLEPFYEHDPNTPADCNLWWNSDDGISCDTVFLIAGVSADDLATLNPSFKSCSDWKTNWSYCIKASSPGTPAPAPSSTLSATSSSGTTASTSTTKTPTTTTSTTPTKPGNGITTPQPFQPGMVDNCNKFYFVAQGETCQVVSSRARISLGQFYAWNPSVGNDCSRLWANVNVCVGVIGQQGTPTNPSNGIKTPQPTQPGLVSNCYKFHFVQPGQFCADIASKFGISLGQLYQWNPSIGNTCSDLWANVHVCVGVFDRVPAHQKYGCYSEVDQRALSYAGLTGQADMTIEFCAVYCMVEKGQKVFGVQFGGECWCGNSLTIGSVKVADGDCNMPCAGNSGQQCGAASRLNVYGSDSVAPLAYKYHGCYTEGTNTRALGVARLESGSLTVAQCAQYCLLQTGTEHFALEFGRECWCGNNLGTGAVSVPESECNMACSGNSGQVCGAANRLNLYSKQLERPPMKFRYDGCFTELTTGGRALNGGVLADDGMTVEKCAKFCIDKGLPMFGLQFSRECFCGTQRSAGSVAAAGGDCNMACSGNSGQKCGGTSRLSVYVWP